MADLKFTSELDASGVISGADKVSKGLDRLGKSSQNSGRGLLNLSYGFEDFTQAGMRGVLNNIPQILLGFGVGAGLAGAVSLIAVTADIATKAYDDLEESITGSGKAAAMAAVIDKSLASEMERLGKSMTDMGRTSMIEKLESLSKSGMSSFAKATSASATSVSDLAKSLEAAISQRETLRGMDNEIKTLSSGNAITSSEESAQKELRIREQIFSLTKQNEQASQAIGSIERNQSRVTLDAAIKRQKMVSEDEIIQMEKQLVAKRVLAEARKAQLEQADKARGGSVAGIIDKIQSVTSSENIMTPLLKGTSILFGSALFGKEEMNNYIKGLDEGVSKSSDQVAKSKELVAIAEKKLADVKALRDFQKGEIQNQDAGLAKSQEEIDKLNEKVKLNEQLVSFRQQELAKQQEIARLSTEEEKKKNTKLMVENASKQGITPDGMLSSLGRIGGAAREGVVALNAITLQKNQLTALKQIEKNTRSSRGAVYN
jgi:hypothetical protein